MGDLHGDLPNARRVLRFSGVTDEFGDWSGDVLAHGSFYSGWVTELKLRLYLLTRRPGSVNQLLSQALSRGMNFLVAYPKEYIEGLRANDARSLEALPAHLAPNYVDPVLPIVRSRTDGWAVYVEAVRRILERPEAVAFLMQGGILWRLALEFGPEDIVRRLLDGPSTSLVCHLHGSESSSGKLYDDVSPAERDVLLGKTEGPNGISHRWW